MGMKYSFDARFEFARKLSATFQRPASNGPMSVKWSAIIRYRSFPTLLVWFRVSAVPNVAPFARSSVPKR